MNGTDRIGCTSWVHHKIAIFCRKTRGVAT